MVAADAAGEFKTPPVRRDEGFTPLRGYTSSVSLRLTPVSLRVGRSTGLTRHRRVIQHRGPPQGEGLRGAAFNGADPSRGRLWGVRPRGEG